MKGRVWKDGIVWWAWHKPAGSNVPYQTWFESWNSAMHYALTGRIDPGDEVQA